MYDEIEWPAAMGCCRRHRGTVARSQRLDRVGTCWSKLYAALYGGVTAILLWGTALALYKDGALSREASLCAAETRALNISPVLLYIQDTRYMREDRNFLYCIAVCNNAVQSVQKSSTGAVSCSLRHKYSAVCDMRRRGPAAMNYLTATHDS